MLTFEDMKKQSCARQTGRVFAVAVGFIAASYIVYVGWTFLRFSKRKDRSNAGLRSALIDELMPTYDVRECHQVTVAAPLQTAFRAVCQIDLKRSRLIRTIFKTRELLLAGRSDEVFSSSGLVDQAKAWGWAVLAERSARELAFGAVTQPWVAHPIFRGLSAKEFLSFKEPNYVKIAWTLAADPMGSQASLVHTETRVSATDAVARSKFRIYWAFLSPGIILIRRIALALAKAEAETLASK